MVVLEHIYGVLGIGTINPIHPLDVSGNIRGSAFIGSGSSLTNLNYNNISSNKPIFISPLIQDISNNITIDLSAYPLKINIDTSLNDLQTKKQDNLTLLIHYQKIYQITLLLIYLGIL